MIKRLVETVKNGKDREAIGEAGQKLLELGPVVIPHIIESLKTPAADGEHPFRLIAMLRLLGKPAHLPMLEAVKNGNLAQRAALIPFFLGNAEAVSLTIGEADDPEVERKRVAERAKNTELYGAVRDPETIATFRPLLRDKDTRVASSAARILGYVGPYDVMPDLAAATKNPNTDVALFAFEGMVGLAKPEDAKLLRDTFDAVHLASKEEDIDEKGRNLRLIYMLRALVFTRNPAGLELHRNLFKHGDVDVRDKACYVLLIQQRPALVPDMLPLLEDKERVVRCQSLRAIGLMTGAKHLDKMIVFTKSEDEHERAAAVMIIGESNSVAGVSTVVALVKDPSPIVRMATAITLGKFPGAPSEQGLKTLLKDKNETIRGQAAKSLREIKIPE